jgi:hypothetical protein
MIDCRRLVGYTEVNQFDGLSANHRMTLVLNAVVCSRVREPQEALSAAQQRGADMADVPGGASGLLVRVWKP